MKTEPIIRYRHVHIPKTGGTTLHIIMRNYFGTCGTWSHPLGDEYTLKWIGLPDEKKKQIKFLAGHSAIFMGHPDLDRFAVKFTMLREPIARAISQLQHIKDGKGSSLNLPEGGFDVQAVIDENPYALGNIMCRTLIVNPDWPAPSKEMKNHPEIMAEIAFHNLLTQTHWGLQEHYWESVANILSAMDLDDVPVNRLIKENAAGEERIELNSGQIQQLEDLNEADILLYEKARKHWEGQHKYDDDYEYV